MIFSKSFGYAVRGILYIASQQQEKQVIQVEEISARLEVPRHFMGKILKRLAKENILTSYKGPSGGFTVNESTLSISLIRILEITNDVQTLNHCVLRLKECNGENPCPMHFYMETVKNQMKEIFNNTTIYDLTLKKNGSIVRKINELTTPSPLQDSQHLRPV